MYWDDFDCEVQCEEYYVEEEATEDESVEGRGV